MQKIPQFPQDFPSDVAIDSRKLRFSKNLTENQVDIDKFSFEAFDNPNSVFL